VTPRRGPVQALGVDDATEVAVEVRVRLHAPTLAAHRVCEQRPLGYRPIMKSNGLLGVELRHLKAFEAVARHRSFGAAAAELGYTQSAVSQQLAYLEKQLGQRLLERGGGSRSVRLTEPGRVVLRHAKALASRLDALGAELDGLSRVRIVRVGVFQSVGERIVPALLGELAATHPEVELDIVEEVNCDPLEEGAASGLLDLAFTLLPYEDPRTETTCLMRDEHLLVVPAGHPAADEPATLSSLAAMPMVGYRGCRGQVQMEDRMAAAGLPLRIVRRADGNGIMHGLVAAGEGMCLLPQLAFDALDPRVAGIDLHGLVPPREIGLVWQRKRRLTPAAEAVIAAARTVCARLAVPAA